MTIIENEILEAAYLGEAPSHVVLDYCLKFNEQSKENFYKKQGRISLYDRTIKELLSRKDKSILVALALTADHSNFQIIANASTRVETEKLPNGKIFVADNGTTSVDLDILNTFVNNPSFRYINVEDFESLTNDLSQEFLFSFLKDAFKSPFLSYDVLYSFLKRESVFSKLLDKEHGDILKWSLCFNEVLKREADEEYGYDSEHPEFQENVWSFIFNISETEDISDEKFSSIDFFISSLAKFSIPERYKDNLSVSDSDSNYDIRPKLIKSEVAKIKYLISLWRSQSSNKYGRLDDASRVRYELARKIPSYQLEEEQEFFLESGDPALIKAFYSLVMVDEDLFNELFEKYGDFFVFGLLENELLYAKDAHNRRLKIYQLFSKVKFYDDFLTPWQIANNNRESFYKLNPKNISDSFNIYPEGAEFDIEKQVKLLIEKFEELAIKIVENTTDSDVKFQLNSMKIYFESHLQTELETHQRKINDILQDASSKIERTIIKSKPKFKDLF